MISFSNVVFSQDNFPLIVKHYDLNLSFDFNKETLNGICEVKIENQSDTFINQIPFLLYRLMKVRSIENQSGKGVNFTQNVVSFDDFEKLQVNYVSINENLKPHSSITLTLHYNGYLLGYQETGMKYIKDRISTAFTLIRNDSYSYPILAKPSIAFLRKNITSKKFTYKINVNVPDSLMVANGGTLLLRQTKNGISNFIYERRKPGWRIDIAISPYRYVSTERLNMFFFPNDSLNAEALLNSGIQTMKLYSNWWGKLKNENFVTIIETEMQSGGQTDESTILLPQEAFNANNDYGFLYHELSHLWNVRIAGGTGLSPRWEEGLAAFCQYYMNEYFNPRTKVTLDKVANRNLKMLKRHFDSEPEMYEIPLYEFGNYGKTEYSYIQGMVLFTVLYEWLGKDKFDLVLRTFYEKYYKSGASTKDFTQLWEKTVKAEGLTKFFNDWIYTTNYTTFINNNNSIDDIVKHYVK